MKKIIINILILLVVIIMLALAAGRIGLSIAFSGEVKQLFDQSKNISDRRFSFSQLSSLPEPVQLYFKHVLKDGQPYISYVRLKHTGTFKTGLDKEPVEITGEEYFTTDTPGFVWKGVTSFFTGRDMYVSGKGRLIVSLFSLVKIVDGSGPDYDQGELLRWLGESVWFPTNLLPSERLRWTPIDSHTAGLTFNYNNITLYYRVGFNENYEITEFETKRSMGKNRIETWIGRAGDYREINGIMIPLKIAASWRLGGADYSYAEFHVKEIEFVDADREW